MASRWSDRAAMILVMSLAAGPLSAQAADTLGWKYTAKLTAVWAAGNSESSTFGLGSTLRKPGARSELKFDASAVRTDTGIRTRRAIGTTTAFRVETETNREKTAEAYGVRARYDRNVSNRLVLFTGVDWMRNTFAGIDSRTLLAVGAGSVWVARDNFRFKTDYGFTYTFQEDVVQNPFLKASFPGVRFTWDLMRRLTQTTQFESVLIGDLNIDSTDDVRFDFTNSLSLAINSNFALRPGLQLLWRNDPALTEIELFTGGGTNTGQKVRVPLQKLDSFFTMALVVTL